MFLRASVDVNVYRDVVYWLQDQQDAQSDRKAYTTRDR